MNKSELVEAVADATDTTKKQVEIIINSTLAKITNAVAQGDKVLLVGFGTFDSRDREPRTGRNPKTGEAIKIPAAKVPIFAAGKNFREEVNSAD